MQSKYPYLVFTILNFIFLIGCTTVTKTPLSAPIVISTNKDMSHNIWANVKINDEEKWFTLDTGSYFTTIPNDNQTKSFSSQGTASNRESSGVQSQCDVVSPADMKLGDLVWSKPTVRRCSAVDSGNLGIDFFDSKIVSLDPEVQKIFILNKLPSNQKTWPITRTSPGRSVLLPVHIGSQAVKAIFDTNASFTTVDGLYIDKHPEQFKEIKSLNSVTDAAGNPLSIKLYEVHSLEIGPWKLLNEKIYRFDFPPQLRDFLGPNIPVFLGVETIMKAKWVLDLKHDEWLVFPL